MKTRASLLLSALIGVILLTGGCTSEESDGFAIYLTRDDVPPDRMEMLSHVDIADHPIVALKDVITYDARTHEIGLTDQAFERVLELDVPMTGKSFVVCVDRAPLYWGAFWTPVSSWSFSGIIIQKPLGDSGPKAVTLEPGYPSPSFYAREDPRNNAAVIKSLETAGKLVGTVRR